MNLHLVYIFVRSNLKILYRVRKIIKNEKNEKSTIISNDSIINWKY